MDWDVVKSRLSNRLSRKGYGGFTLESSVDKLAEEVLGAINIIRTTYRWNWEYQSETLTTTDDNLGPYDPPSDFLLMVQARGIYQYGFDPVEGQLLRPILNTTSERYDVYLREADQKLYFRDNPGNSSLTFYFEDNYEIGSDNIAAALLPVPSLLYEPLADLVEAAYASESEDSADLEARILQRGMGKLTLAYSAFSAGQSKQRQISPNSPAGVPLDGVGEQRSLHGPLRGFRRSFRRRW